MSTWWWWYVDPGRGWSLLLVVNLWFIFILNRCGTRDNDLVAILLMHMKNTFQTWLLLPTQWSCWQQGTRRFDSIQVKCCFLILLRIFQSEANYSFLLKEKKIAVPYILFLEHFFCLLIFFLSLFSGDGTLSVCNLRSNKVRFLFFLLPEKAAIYLLCTH